jgi:hypothetical protein
MSGMEFCGHTVCSMRVASVEGFGYRLLPEGTASNASCADDPLDWT